MRHPMQRAKKKLGKIETAKLRPIVEMIQAAPDKSDWDTELVDGLTQELERRDQASGGPER